MNLIESTGVTLMLRAAGRAVKRDAASARRQIVIGLVACLCVAGFSVMMVVA